MTYIVWGHRSKDQHPAVRHVLDRLVTLADAKRSADRALNENEGFDKVTVEDQAGRTRYIVASLGEEE